MDDFDPDAFLAGVQPTDARLMSYGPIEGEFHNAAMFGPQGNALQPYDVAASPDMGLDQGDWIRVNGQLHRVADSSYYSPGNPTSQTIELRDQRDQGMGAVARAEPFDPDVFLNRVKPFDPDEFLKTTVTPSLTPATDASQAEIFSPLPRGTDTGITPPPTAAPAPVIPPSLNPLRPEAPVASDHSAEWNARQKEMADAAATAGLPPLPTGNARLVDAIKRSQAAGFDFPNFSTTHDPTGDRTVTMDMENLVGALDQREAATKNPSERAKIVKEKAYWLDQIATSGMTSEQWKQQTGEPEPAYQPPTGIPNITELRKGRIKTAQQLSAEQPDWMQNAVEAAAEVGSEQIPKSIPELGEFVRGISSPVAGAGDELRKSYGLVRDLIEGKTLPEAEKANFPESQMIVEAEETPPFSKERFKAGFQVMTQLGMATAITAQLKGGGKGAITKGQEPESVQAQPESGVARGQAEAPGVSDRVQPAAAVGPEEIGKPLNLRYEGLQDYAGAIPNEHLYTIMEEGPAHGATFGVPEGGGLPELKARYEETKVKFSPPEAATQEVKPSAAGIAPPTETAPAYLKPAPETQNILNQQAVEPTITEPTAPPEGGALFGGGGKRAPKPGPIGKTPMGDKNFLRIPGTFKRAGKGIMTSGARHTLARTKNKVGRALGKATRQHVDIEQELFGMHEKMLRDAMQGVPRKRLDAAFAEVGRYIQDVENKRPTQPLLPDAQKILDAWYDVGESTGNIARANNVQVWDAKLGKHRPMGHVKNFIPRMFKTEVEAVLRDQSRDPALFRQLADAIAQQRGITLEEAAAELQKTAGRFSSNDHFANIEMARSERLPEIFYEHDLRNLATRYLPAFSERMSQIIAFGQRLGPREAPSKMNLWDIARKEAEDPGGHTVEWLNAAEDQATGFRRDSTGLRLALRGQALGNASLLSDPTTTVVRNLLSGLSVTAEHHGIGRTVRAMVQMKKLMTSMDAKEIGVMRDDIGHFLGAEQLGDRKLDNFIREFQTEALKVTGFTPSESIVRRTNAMTAATFARNAAESLEKNPTSRLSREALAKFKRLDVDPEKIVAEKGDWKTGPETRKFIRSDVRESQGGYRYDQVPLWAGSVPGRFLYQYGRWSIQRAGDIFRNTLKDAIGENVEFRGQQMRYQNVMPLMRLGLFMVGLGETFGGIASVLFDRDRKDASFDEISEAWNEDQGRAVGLLAERITNDIIMAGTGGLISQPIDWIKATKDQSRLKNPAEPPSLAGVKAIMQLGRKAYDQGGSLTRRDILDVATALVRGPKNVMDVAAAKFGEPLYQSQNDQRTLRNAARRWAKEQQMDVSPPGGYGDFRKSKNAPVFESINDALLSGDAHTAREVAAEFYATSKNKETAKKAVEASVKGKEPFRAGQYAADKYEEAFLKWTKTHLSEQDQEQINRVIKTYNTTAEAAGFLPEVRKISPKKPQR